MSPREPSGEGALEVHFEPLAKSTASFEATRLIKHMILEGRLRPGQKLPAERELSESLGISRATVRESIKALVAMNVLETRHGSGTFVASLETKELLEPLVFVLSLAKRALADLFEVRLLLEPGTASLAAERASEDEIEKIWQCCAAIAAAETNEDILKLDLRLHELIAEATHNELLLSVLGSLSHLGIESRALTVELPGVAQQTRRDHERIVEAIRARRPAAARDAMRGHISNVEQAARSLVSPASDY
jgi:GntR family transcriptional repressor for pyruvate dehydrogenase complex